MLRYGIIACLLVLQSHAESDCMAMDKPAGPNSGLVRSGPDLSCFPMPGRSAASNLQECQEMCCNDSNCKAISFNSPWVLNISYMKCTAGSNVDCCCLKSSAGGLGPNQYPMNITTGLKQPKCTTDEDCSLNGVCDTSSGQCTCDPEWSGSRDCSRLNLVAPDQIIPAYPSPDLLHNTTSWGGSVIRDRDNASMYHLFVAEMSHGCGMSSWSTNSIITHGVADSPLGPFTRQEVVMHEFAHNPMAVRAPDGTYLIYHIGCGTGTSSPACTDCSGGYTNHSCKQPGEQVSCAPHTANILYADSPKGPWKQLNAPVLSSSEMTWPGLDNPTATFFTNGSVLMLVRGGDPKRESSSDGVVTAPSWRGPYQKHGAVGSGTSPSVEDPFVYQDHRGNFHALFHKFTDEHPGCGGHAFSRDGFNWTLTDIAAYDTVVQTSDGTAHAFNRRERPHLLFDDSGTRPTVLYTTLTNWSSSGANLGHDKAFTFAQRIGG